VFALFDAVAALYGTPAGAACGLDALLEHRVPAGLLRHIGGGPVLGVRPDFQLVPEGGGYRLVATELEICPSAQGFAHSKAVLAALQLPAMRARIASDSAETLAILDRCIPETMLLDERSAARVLRERADWVLKYAGFDQGEAAWGGRSLQLGVHSSDAEWAELVGRALGYPWPVVAQRATPSAQLALAYAGARAEWNLSLVAAPQQECFTMNCSLLSLD